MDEIASYEARNKYEAGAAGAILGFLAGYTLGTSVILWTNEKDWDTNDDGLKLQGFMGLLGVFVGYNTGVYLYESKK